MLSARPWQAIVPWGTSTTVWCVKAGDSVARSDSGPRHEAPHFTIVPARNRFAGWVIPPPQHMRRWDRHPGVRSIGAEAAAVDKNFEMIRRGPIADRPAVGDRAARIACLGLRQALEPRCKRLIGVGRWGGACRLRGGQQDAKP